MQLTSEYFRTPGQGSTPKAFELVSILHSLFSLQVASIDFKASLATHTLLDSAASASLTSNRMVNSFSNYRFITYSLLLFARTLLLVHYVVHFVVHYVLLRLCRLYWKKLCCE